MEYADKSPAPGASAETRKFRFGPPQDRERMVQLFALLLERADEYSAQARHFDVPFGFLLRLGYRHQPTLADLRRYHDEREPGSDWPELARVVADSSSNGRSSGMFFHLLAAGLQLAPRFDVGGPQLCRILAAVGQTLGARSADYRTANRLLAEHFRSGLQPVPEPPSSRIKVSMDGPAEIEFRNASEQGGSIVLNELVLWHASHIGPASAQKLENQDATYAVQVPDQACRHSIVFALADGVGASMGARIAATAVVRRFCECVIPLLRPDEPVTQTSLVEAARETQQSLDRLAEDLLGRKNMYIFDLVRGDSIQEKAAERILGNTLNPTSKRIPPALASTLLGGVAQSAGPGEFRVELLRIGDGVIEQISSGGEITSIAATDPQVTLISEIVGPGPRAREVLDNPEDRVGSYTVTLRRGETLIISSDGLTRGHDEPVSARLSALLGGAFWNVPKSEPDAALNILRNACQRAEETAKDHPDQALFADNVSLIMIRCGG